MKLINYFFIFSFILISKSFAAPSFVRLEKNAQSYTQSQSAVLTAHIQIQPANPEMEIYLKSFLDDQPLKITRASASIAVAITGPLLGEGVKTWGVKVYLRNKASAVEFEKTIHFYRVKNISIAKSLETETDVEVRANLQEQINRNLETIAQIQALADSDLRLIEEKNLDIHVGEVLSFGQLVSSPLVSINSNAASNIHHVGERAHFFVDVLTGFSGSDGIQEVLVKASVAHQGALEDINLYNKRIGERNFSFSTDVLRNGQIGSRIFEATVHIRSKAKADSIRNTIGEAGTTRSEYLRLKEETQDLEEKLYYQSLVQELDQLHIELLRQLEEMLVQVGSVYEFSFEVTA